MTTDDGERPLVYVTGGTVYGGEPTRYDLRLHVDPAVDQLDLQARLSALVAALDRELRARRETQDG